MRPRLNLILLGVSNIATATAFYEALGWPKAPTSHDGFAKFDLGGVVLGLLPREDFARDAGFASAEGNGFAGMALAYIARSADDVPRILDKAAALGAEVIKPATRNDWGIAGYFRDPDGHLFEVCYEDGWIFDADDNLRV
ncbi:hypothetical protein SAMN02745857_02020 [Andreprevotia lacus DSM 23236]|jgi:catechol 2,3-dioxygenase-like lactoylglutathione lyase family enzyme|uniref:VOC domain-containing protein n=1 Tax=Andreprevotia lacus DSM 23236 TaxID=1121001 RepID=A0A1W1XM79_9NEIS|nr:VOC family protein [Andreprevotia lacus]SMC24962.1 hypothetical protein SAMN02745857_02020 [Andreprevotia lacus DSM 23236]